MEFEYSRHWTHKKPYRSDITDDILEYAIIHSPAMRDKHWPDARNAITEVPPMGRTLKVVYRRSRGKWRIITAYWLD